MVRLKLATLQKLIYIKQNSILHLFYNVYMLNQFYKALTYSKKKN